MLALHQSNQPSMLTCLEWGRVDCLELERNKRSERSMIDGQGVVSHQRDRRSRGCSRPDVGRLPVICSLLCSTHIDVGHQHSTPKDRLSRNMTRVPTINAKTHSQPPKPEIQGARDRQQLPTARAGARCAAPAGSARPGLARGRSPGSPAGGGAGGASAGC